VEESVAERLAATETRLAAMPPQLQEELINWGYAVCDAGLRSHLLAARAPVRLPYDAASLA
jgi:NTE family protein